MRLKNFLIPLILVLIPLLFFYKTVIFQEVPFPGDLLVGNYEPYKSDSNLGFVPGSVPHKGQGADVVRELYPWKYFTIESLKAGSFPLWNPYVFSGNPHFANLQSGTLYPVNILFFVLPFVDAWSLYIILQFIFMIVFTYLYLRQIKLAREASIIGAVAFAFSGFITVWGWYGNLGHTLSFLPLVFLCIEKILQKKTHIYWYVILIFAIAFSIFAGYIQFVMYIYILSAAYIASRFLTASKERDIKRYLLLALCFIAGSLVSAVQLLPIVEVVRLSLRSTYSYPVLLERLMPPESTITLLVPDFFGNPATLNYFLRGGSSLERAASIGVWPLILAVVAVFTKKTFTRNFFMISAVIIFISTLSIPPVAYFHSIGIPFLSTGIPTRALSIFCFCMAVLAAIGIDSYLKKGVGMKKILFILGTFLLFFLVLWIATYVLSDPRFAVSRRNLIIPTGIFIVGSLLVIFSKIQRRFTVMALICITVFELFYSFQKFNSFVPKSFVYPETEITQKLREIQGINRYWGYGNANIDTNFQIIDKNYGTDGYDPLFSKRYGEFMSASEKGRVPQEVPRSVANIYKGYGVNDLKNNMFRQRALDLTGTKFVLNKTENKGLDSAFSEKAYKLIWESGGWQIYENKIVLPRVSLFGSYRVEKNREKTLKTLYSPEFNFHTTVLLDEVIPAKFHISPDSKASVRVVFYHPNEMEIKTKSSQDQILLISDNFFPGWMAYVDGKNTSILRANYTFRGIPLLKGEHSVVLRYSPQSFWVGVWVSLGSVTCLILTLVFVTITKRHDKSS